MTNKIPVDFANQLPRQMAHKPRQARSIPPIVIGFGVPLICVLMLGALMFTAGNLIMPSESAAAVVAGTQTATSTPETRVITKVVYIEQIVEVEKIITRIPDPTSTPVPTNTPLPTWTPTPPPSRTPIPPTPTSAYQAALDHDTAIQRKRDNQVSFFWWVMAYLGTPTFVLCIAALAVRSLFNSRDKILESRGDIESEAEIRKRAIAEARQAERDANAERLAALPINQGERDRRPKPTTADALSIQRYLIQGDMSRSAIAVAVYGNSGGPNLPKVDYVIEEMQRIGSLPPSPLD